MKFINDIPYDWHREINWNGKTYTSLPTNGLISSTGISTTTITSGDELSKEILKRLDKIEKEHSEMREYEILKYEEKDMADISSGKDMVFKCFDNVIIAKNIRDVDVTSDIWELPKLTITCEKVETQRIPPYANFDWKILSPKVLEMKTPIVVEPKKVIFSGPATTIIWEDGTKTTVKCQEGDEWSDEVGIGMCYLKKMLGNKGNYNNIFRKAMKVAEVHSK